MYFVSNKHHCPLSDISQNYRNNSSWSNLKKDHDRGHCAHCTLLNSVNECCLAYDNMHMTLHKGHWTQGSVNTTFSVGQATGCKGRLGKNYRQSPPFTKLDQMNYSP